MPQIELAAVCCLADDQKCHRDGLCKCRLPLPEREAALRGETKGRFYICEFLELKRLE